MDPQQFARLPSSTNAVESYNRFGKSTHPLPLKEAMMATYKEDMVKAFEVIARNKGLPVSYEKQSVEARAHRADKQSKARLKRFTDMRDDPEGPPDTRKKFKGNQANTVMAFSYKKNNTLGGCDSHYVTGTKHYAVAC